MLITRYAKGFMSNVAVLLGIIFGFLLSWMMMKSIYPGYVMLHGFVSRRCHLVCRFSIPFHTDHDCRVNHRVYQSMGMFLALGGVVGRKLSSHDISRGLRVDGVGTMIGGTFNASPTRHFHKTSAWLA
ncbi:solute carrier family 23 protein [Shigella flexneri]